MVRSLTHNYLFNKNHVLIRAIGFQNSESSEKNVSLYFLSGVSDLHTLPKGS